MLKHYKKCNWVYCVSLILDSRHKYECFDNSCWGESIKLDSIKKFEEIFKSKYFVPPEPQRKEQADRKKNLLSSILSRSQKAPSWKDEISTYLNMPYPDWTCDILMWWKENSVLLPNLSKMARDILAIPASSVAVERFFSSGSIIMNNKRTSLKDETFKNLMLINSWAKSKLSDIVGVGPIFDYK